LRRGVILSATTMRIIGGRFILLMRSRIVGKVCRRRRVLIVPPPKWKLGVPAMCNLPLKM